MTERFNQTLSHSLIKIIDETQEDWDEKLDAVLFAYRVSKQRTTGYSPFFMLYHREPRLPIDIEVMPDSAADDGHGAIEEYISAMVEVRESLKPNAMENIKSQAYQKKYYDKRHEPQV